VTPETKANDKQTGQGFVEFALILPVLLLLMWGVIEFGRLLFIYTEVSNAAREAVRFGVVRGEGDVYNYDLCGEPNSSNCDICDAGNAATVLTELQDNNFEIIYDDGAGVEQDTCPDTDGVLYEYEDGDRLVVTISYEVQPLVLFQGAGPFEVQFTAARTLMHQGIAMSGFDDVPAGNPHLGVPPTFVFVHDPDYRMACQGSFKWTTVPYAQGYDLFQWVPVAQHVGRQTTCGEDGGKSCAWPLPGDLEYMYPVSIADIYYVQAYRNSLEPEMDDSPPSNYVVINCLSKVEGLTFVERPNAPSCDGYFEWDEVVGADEYRFYYPSGITETVTSNRYPPANDLTTLNSRGPYTVTARTAFLLYATATSSGLSA